MPSLILFGQRTPVGGDDLRLYAVLTLLMRLAQAGCSIALFYKTSALFDLQDILMKSSKDRFNGTVHGYLLNCLEEGNTSQEKVSAYTWTYLSLSLILAIAGAIFAESIWFFSGLGTPTDGRMVSMGNYCFNNDDEARRAERQRSSTLKHLCQFHLTILFAIRVTAAVFGSFVYDELDYTCDCIVDIDWEDLDYTTTALFLNITNASLIEAFQYERELDCRNVWPQIFAFLITTHYTELILNVIVLTYVTLQAITPAFARLSNAAILPRTLDSESRWKLFCRCCCTVTSLASCCLMGGQEVAVGDFTEIAVLLSDFFDGHGTLDVVPSDMVAALLLLQEVQKHQVRENRRDLLEQAKKQQSKPKLVIQEEPPAPAPDLMPRILELETHAPGVGENQEVIVETVHSKLDTNEGDERADGHDIQTLESKRRVIEKVKETQNLSGITYRLKRYEGAGTRWEAHVTNLLNLEDDNDRVCIAEGARFMRLSLAIYTWIMYSINRPCIGMCTVCCGALARDCQKQQSDTPRYYRGDGHCCRLHSTAFMKEAGIHDENEIVYAYFHSGVVETPYAVVLDHVWRSIVIVCRGTLSLEDVLTDLTIHPTSLEDVGKASGFDGTDCYAHGGILETCQWLMKDMKQHQTLERLFAEDSKYTNYRLRVTGHSLGAGIAAILAMMLRPTHQNLRCHAFCPPGCTLSENAANECEDYITSYLLDADIIPRASLNSLENLRHDLVDIISRIKVPKNAVFDEFVVGCGKKGDEKNLDDFLYKEDEIPDSFFLREWKEYRRRYDERKTERGSISVELYVPGKIIQLFPTSGEDGQVEDADVTAANSILNCCQSKPKPQFVSRWAHRLDFRVVRIVPHFLDDHIPLAVLTRLEDEAERFGLTSPFLMEEPIEVSKDRESDFKT